MPALHISSLQSNNPAYLFLHSHVPTNTFARYPEIVTTAKAVKFGTEHPQELRVYCIPCRSFVSYNATNGTNILHDIDVIWDSWNTKDLRKHYLESDTGDGEETCSLKLRNFINGCNAGVCSVPEMRKKFNATLLYTPYVRRVPRPFPHDRMGAIFFRWMVNPKAHEFLSSNGYWASFVIWRHFSFVVVINRPGPMEGLKSFSAPLDGPMWVLLLLSSLAKTAVLQVIQVLLKDKRNWGMKVVNNFLNLISIHLGQVGGNVLKVFGVPEITAGSVLLPVWFFSCYILMANVYQGSIFTFLAVPLIPEVPTDLEALVESNLPIMTNTYSRVQVDYRDSSILKEDLIPELVKVVRNKKLLTELDKNLFYVMSPRRDFDVLASNISYLRDVSSQNVTMSTKSSFAIMNKPSDLALLTGLMRLIDAKTVSKFIVAKSDGTGFDTPFSQFECHPALRNFFHVRIVTLVRQLEESGMFERWDTLVRWNAQLLVTGKVGKKHVAILFAKLMADWRESPTVFHQDEVKPVVVDVLKSILELCAILFATSGVVWMYETNGENLIKTLLVYIT